MKVRLNGTAAGNGSSGSWLAHWEKHSGLNAFMCYATGCIRRPSVGAHVQKDGPPDTNWYVIPLCEDCSRKRGQDLDIWDAATLVSPGARSASSALPSPSRSRASRPVAVFV
jgi:hypothetical protein